MSYDIQKEGMGSAPVYYVEIDLGYCSNDYGVAPCTATGAAGAECFNCFNTCQDVDNFASTTKTYRFSSVRLDGLQTAGDAPTFPTVLTVGTAPTQLTPGKGLGVRSTCSISLSDHPWTDEGIDPYVDTRSYNPDEQGTFWGKLLARNPFYEGKEIRVFTGYLTDEGTYDASNFISRTYFIDTIKGPDKSGKVSITGKDILRFADRTKAQLPNQSGAVLDVEIDDSQISFDITDTDDDVKDSHDAGQSYIRIDDETMLIESITGSNPNYNLTVVRGVKPSVYQGTVEKVSHGEGATVQDCHLFNAERLDDVAKYMLETVVGLDSSFLDIAGWKDTVDFGLRGYLVTTLLTEPIGIKELLDELSDLTVFWFWDERDQLVKMGSLLNKFEELTPFNDNENIVADSVAVARDDKARVSQTWFAFGHRLPTLPLDEKKNFTTVKVAANLELEGPDAYDQKKVRMIFSRWLPTGLASVSLEIATRLLNYYKNTKTVITMTMAAKDDDTWTGDIIKAQTRQVQSPDGSSPAREYRVIQVSEKLMPGNALYQYALQSTDLSSRVGLITPDKNPESPLDDFPVYTLASDSLKSQYAFISPDSGTFADGTESYKIQ